MIFSAGVEHVQSSQDKLSPKSNEKKVSWRKKIVEGREAESDDSDECPPVVSTIHFQHSFVQVMFCMCSTTQLTLKFVKRSTEISKNIFVKRFKNRGLLNVKNAPKYDVLKTNFVNNVNKFVSLTARLPMHGTR